MSSSSRADGSKRRGRKRAERAVAQAGREGAPVSELEAHLGYWLRAVSNHVSYAFKAKVERHGVTVAEWVVMRSLFDEEESRPSKLSAKLGLTRGAISKLLDRLASKGFVAAKADPEDARAQVVALTADARRLVPKLAALADQNDAETFGHLSAEQRALLLSLCKALVDRLGVRSPPIE